MNTNRRNLKLTVAYDGSDYHGFQRQSNAISVQQVLEEKLSLLLQEDIRLAGAARTDAGVHAHGQVITLQTASRIPVDRIPPAAAGILPPDIAVTGAVEVPAAFHARFSARGKIYQYRIYNSMLINPLLRNYAWQITRPLDVAAMNQALQSLVGEHDFSAFQAAGSSARNPVRTLFGSHCKCQGADIEFAFYGNGFLYHMVRNIVGTAVDVGSGKIDSDEFQHIFTGRNRKLAGATAPPQGLYLWKVLYGEDVTEEKP